MTALTRAAASHEDRAGTENVPSEPGNLVHIGKASLLSEQQFEVPLALTIKDLAPNAQNFCSSHVYADGSSAASTIPNILAPAAQGRYGGRPDTR